MKAIITFLWIVFCSCQVFATAQISDLIIYNGTKYALNSNPLEQYFEKNPDKRPQGEIMSTALWRGYVATFEIKENQLFLRDIEIQVSDTTRKKNWKSVLHEVFPDQPNIKLDWLTGLLVLPHGKLVNYVHMGYASTYENYILLEIDGGNLKKEKKFNYKDYEAFKSRQFEAFKKTDQYKQLKAQLKADKTYDDEYIEQFLRIFVIDYTSKIMED
jgi:hypothetical protein